MSQQHVTRQEMEAFCALELSGGETIRVARHFHRCPECQRLFNDVSQSQQYHRPLIFNFSPEVTVRDEHVAYDDLVAYTEGQMEETESALLERHCRVCPRCQDDVREFQAYAGEFEQYREVWLGPPPSGQRIKSWWEKITSAKWLPHPTPVMISVAGVVLGMAVLAGLILYRQPASVEVKAPAEDPSPYSSPATSTSPPAVAAEVNTASGIDREGKIGDQTSLEKPPSAKGSGLLLALNDSGRRYGFDAAGQVVGTDGYPAELREEIARVLRGEISRSVPPAELASTPVKTRGAENNRQVKLIAPLSTYVATERPILQWRPLAEDVRYVVSVVDEDFNEIVKSPELATTSWQVSQPLVRGAIYRWQVLAFKNGQELTPTQREVGKFMVISEEKFRKIEQARKKYTSHLVLGLIYKKENMLHEAEKEFRQLVKTNPRAKIAKQLLQSVRNN